MREVRPAAYDSKIEGNIIFTRPRCRHELDAQEFPLADADGLACCAIELMATARWRVSTSRASAPR